MKATRQHQADNAGYRLTLEHPIVTGLVLLLIALGFRIMDIFIFRLDERLGEIILSKSLGFALVLGFE